MPPFNTYTRELVLDDEVEGGEGGGIRLDGDDVAEAEA